MRVEPVSGRVTSGPLEPVYVYEAPVRLWHWVTMVMIFVLGVTGYLIGSPPPAIGGEPYDTFYFGWIRMIHVIAGYILVVAFLVRIYWVIVGNHSARSIFFVPFWSGAWWRGFWSQVALLPVPEEGIGPVGRPQPARAGGDVLHVHAGHGVHDRHRHRALRRAVGLGLRLHAVVRMGVRPVRRAAVGAHAASPRHVVPAAVRVHPHVHGVPRGHHERRDRSSARWSTASACSSASPGA